MGEALQVLLGDDAKGLSAPVVSRLKMEWANEHKAWNERDLSDKAYVYWWIDGVYTGLRSEDTDKQCLLVIVGVTPDGSKERVAIGDGIRESKESWRDILLDLKHRGLKSGPLLAVGDGAMGFWGAINEVFPDTRHQRCWLHKTVNILNALPATLQSKAKADLKQIWMAPTAKAADQAFERFVASYGAKYPQATEEAHKGPGCSYGFLRLSRRALEAYTPPRTPLNRPSLQCVIAPARHATAYHARRS